MTDTSIRKGGIVSPTGGIVSADQVTISGDGTFQDPLRGAAVFPRLVFRPGGIAGNGVFVDWAELYAALLSVSEFGTTYLEFDDSLAPVVVPPGVWNFTNVVPTNHIETAPIQPVTQVELADGASIVVTDPVAVLRIEGYGLKILSNRVGPVPPFLGVNLLLDGFGVRLFNTSPSALPMFVSTGANSILISGSCVRAQIGNGQGSPPVPAPLVDVAGGVIGISAGAGLLFNNALTDSVGGGFVFVRSFDDALNGGGGSDTTYDFPALVSGGGVFDASSVEHRDRYFVDPSLAAGTFDAFLNELVRADTSSASVTVNAPSAASAGNRLTVVDFTGNAAAHHITVVPVAGDTIDSPVISANNQAKTWVCDGENRWILISAS